MTTPQPQDPTLALRQALADALGVDVSKIKVTDLSPGVCGCEHNRWRARHEREDGFESVEVLWARSEPVSGDGARASEELWCWHYDGAIPPLDQRVRQLVAAVTDQLHALASEMTREVVRVREAGAREAPPQFRTALDEIRAMSPEERARYEAYKAAKEATP